MESSLQIFMSEFIFLSVEPALKPGILGVSDGVRVVVPGSRVNTKLD